jgi:hypothetical protein
MVSETEGFRSSFLADTAGAAADMGKFCERQNAGRRRFQPWHECGLERRLLLSENTVSAVMVGTASQPRAHVDVIGDPITFTNGLPYAVAIEAIYLGKFHYWVDPGQRLDKSVIQPGQSLTSFLVSKTRVASPRILVVFSNNQTGTALVRMTFAYMTYSGDYRRSGPGKGMVIVSQFDKSGYARVFPANHQNNVFALVPCC